MRTPAEWLTFLREHDIRWIVRSPDYPAPIAAPLRVLEAQGALVPVTQTTVTDFHGLRIQNDRRAVAVVVLEVQN